MPQRADQSVPILDDGALLTRRKESPNWQLKFRVGRRFIRVSTKEHDLDKAKDFSRMFYSRALVKHEAGVPVVSRKFKSVAVAVRDRLQQNYDSEISPVI